VAVAAIHAGAIVLLHSPRSASLFSELIGDLRAQTRIAAISDAAAAAAGPGWSGVAVALEPRDDALLAAAAELADTVPVPAAAVAAGATIPRGLGRSRNRPWLQPLLIGAGAFLLGILLMAWVLLRWDAGGQFLVSCRRRRSPPREPPPRSGPCCCPPGRRGRRTRTWPSGSLRLSSGSGRLEPIPGAAVGNADRARGCWSPIAARRALERGVGLGNLEGLLRQRFGETQPKRWETVIDFAQQPVYAAAASGRALPRWAAADRRGPEPELLAGDRRDELANLVVVRREGTAVHRPARAARARHHPLEAGQVEEALQEVLRLPGRENGRGWIDRAQRYVASRQALDAIDLRPSWTARAPPRAAQQQPAR
jgi:hypothetical protein